ncbi:MAG: ATP-binding protein [Planctomycetes bacterium]|nr:ATP-binding protein [Planctomycetota bacterium]
MPTRMKHKRSKTVRPLQVPLGSLEQIVTQAENNDLSLGIMPFESLSLLEEARSYHDTTHPSQNIMVMVDRTSQSVPMMSDKRILTHVICQMLANAVEASSTGQTVDMGCFAEHNHCTFWVLNRAVIPEFVQSQVYERGFSTKSETRGLGTYSIKLLSEACLNGMTTFTSRVSQGTVFRATFPLTHQP